jgi:hypothetical protein
VNEGRADRHGARVAGKDLCIESVRLRLEDKEDSGIHSAKAIAKLLGQDEVVALMEEDQVSKSSSEDSGERMRPVARAAAPMMSGDEINSVLRLRRHAR